MIPIKFSLVILALSSTAFGYQDIAGYTPVSLVTDHNSLDLDQKFIQQTLADKDYESARNFYELGAHSGSYAVITLDDPLSADVSEGLRVVGLSHSGGEASGTLLGKYAQGDVELTVVYAVSDEQESWVGCRVSALVSIEGAYKDGCFADFGNLTIVNDAGVALQSHSYSYNLREDNQNSRTFWGFSAQAHRKMLKCDFCPFETFTKFNDFFGESDYGNIWIEAAFDRVPTLFPLRGNVDMGELEHLGRGEVIQKGTVLLNLWMYVIYEMEDAVHDCDDRCVRDCNQGNAHTWDEAVAFYTGSLQGEDGTGPGVMLYAVANKMCAHFKTCGRDGGDLTGTAKVNYDIFEHFEEGKREFSRGRCNFARRSKTSIERLMAVPLIQGTLRYAYIRKNDPAAGEKSMAEGATYAAAVVPLVNDCSSADADLIYENMKVGSTGTPDFELIKEAFERNYGCMDVKGSDVGGVWDAEANEYFAGAEPVSSSGSNVGLAIGLTIAILAVLGIGFWVYRRHRNAATKAAPPMETPPLAAAEGLDLT